MQTVRTGEFEGPLELLLELTQKNELSINDVSLANVCEQYIAHIKSFPEFPAEEASGFLVVAATLLLIKSRSLIPSLAVSDAEEREISDLKERLALYAVVRRGARRLDTLLVSERGLASRQPYVIVASAPDDSYTITSAAIRAAMGRLVRLLPYTERRAEAAVTPTVRIEDKIKELLERVSREATSIFSASNAGCRAEVVVMFLALLELLKAGAVSFRQTGVFHPISVHARS